MQKETNEKIQAWKKQFGSVYRITNAKSQSCIIKDPFSDLSIIKKAFFCLQQNGIYDFIESILNDCFLDGDRAIIADDSILGLEEQMNKIVFIPNHTVEELSNGNCIIKCEGIDIEVRKAERKDLQEAQRRNVDNMPFDTAIYLLDKITVSEVEKIDELRKNNRAYIGVLTALNKVRQKTEATVEKL